MAAKKSQKSQALSGNISPESVRSRKFVFTLNNYKSDDIRHIITILDEKDCKYIFGEEVAPTTGTKHLQGYIEFKNQKKYSEIINYCIKTSCPEVKAPTPFKTAYLKTAKGTLEQNYNYCTKEGTFHTNIELKPKLDILQECDFYPWQKEMKELLSGKPDKRTVYWINDPEGCNGKTQFLKHMVYFHEALFTCGGKRNDIINLVFNNKEIMTGKRAMLIWNLPRDIKSEFISYEAIEMVKDGLISNNKFECGSFICNAPHLLIMGNCLPLFHKLTSDRWVVFTIKDKNLIKVDWRDEVAPTTGLDD